MFYKYVCEIMGEALSLIPERQNEIPREIIESLIKTDTPSVKSRLAQYIIDKAYTREENLPEQITADYIAGMTDAYALKTFEELYWI